jgi:hypothetical protein
LEALRSRAVKEIEKIPEKDRNPVVRSEPVSTVIEPTPAEIKSMVDVFRVGQPNIAVQRTVQRKQDEDSLCFSLEQIESVRLAWQDVVSPPAAIEEPVGDLPDPEAR